MANSKATTKGSLPCCRRASAQRSEALYITLWSRGPVFAQQFGLSEYSQSRFLLFVRRIAVLAENSFDDGTHPGADTFLDRPVDGGIAANGINQFQSDQPLKPVSHMSRTMAILNRHQSNNEWSHTRRHFTSSYVHLNEFFLSDSMLTDEPKKIGRAHV